MRCYTDGSVLPIGVDTSGGGRAALATVEGQSCLRWVVEDGSQYLFSAETGTLLSYTTTDRQVISNASSYLDVRHAGDGSLRQIWNLWDGLLNVETSPPRVTPSRSIPLGKSPERTDRDFIPLRALP